MDDINVILADLQGVGRVQLCACNCIHLSVGPVMVTLGLEAFLRTAEMIRAAEVRLAEIVPVHREDEVLGLSRLTH